MKFAIIVLFAIIATSQAHHEDKSLRTECVFTQEDSMLSCHGVEQTVECEAKLLWTEPIDFSLFSISKSESVDLGLHYRLFPRALDNSAWLSNIDISEDGVERYISLHFQQNNENFGLNVADETCWSRLNELFSESLRNETVFVETIESETEIFKVLGDLICSKHYPKETSEMNKRWYGFGVYGRYYRPYYRFSYYSRPYRYYGWKRDSGAILIDDVQEQETLYKDTDKSINTGTPLEQFITETRDKRFRKYIYS